MFRRHGPRFGLYSLIAILAFGVMALASPASAASTTVTIHARICPAHGVTDLFKDCHSHAVTNASFRLDHSGSKHVNNKGNVTFSNVAAGSHIVALTGGDQPNEFLHLRAFCSDSNTGGTAVEYKVRSTTQASFRISVKTGQALVCDVYWIPESGQG